MLLDVLRRSVMNLVAVNWLFCIVKRTWRISASILAQEHMSHCNSVSKNMSAYADTRIRLPTVCTIRIRAVKY